MVDSVLLELLECPVCQSDIGPGEGDLRCSKCNDYFPVVEGIPCFSLPATESDADTADIAFRKDYEWRYHEIDDARSYNISFKNSFRKRLRTRREIHILTTMLRSQGHCRTILDVPCGGGRLSVPMAHGSDHLLEADISPAQLKLALDLKLDCQHGLIASALSLPFKTQSVDGVICPRLSHHLPDSTERKQLVLELMRVAKRFVIFSFTDQKSLKSFARRLSGKPLSRSTMVASEISEIAIQGGGKLKRIMTVGAIGQRHRYALLEKT